MAFIYTQSDLKARMNGGIQGKIGILLDSDDTVNSGVRELLGKVDMRSTKRRSVLAPNLFNGVFPYACPTDLKGQAIIDLPAQAKRADGEWALVPTEEFDRLNGKVKGLLAIDDSNGVRTLKIASAVDSQSFLISELDSTVSGGGLWGVFGDAENLTADDSDFIKGAGSLKFGLSAVAGTTAGIVNNSVNSVDISSYLGGTSAFFVWARINSTTNLTNYILRFGNNSSNYYAKTVTTQADGTAFVAGWNLLKFDVSSLSETGSVTDTALTYFALFMTKTSAKVSESDYKFDWLVLKKGVIEYVRYYSKYGWQSSAGAYKENSTTTDDILVAESDEYELYVKQCIIVAMREIGYSDGEIEKKESDLEKALSIYISRNPSEAKVMMYDYYNY